MYFKNHAFNHDAPSFHEALGISKKQQERCRERVFFSTFANALQGMELYEDEEDRPAQFSTKTGDLSRTLQLIDDQLEYEYTIFMFMKYQTLAQEAMAKYVAMNNSDLSESSKAKLKIMLQLEDLVLQHRVEHGDDDDHSPAKDRADFIVTPGGLMKRIDLVKQSHYSFDTYFNMVQMKNLDGKKPSSGSDFDVDDMLRDIFKGND